MGKKLLGLILIGQSAMPVDESEVGFSNLIAEMMLVDRQIDEKILRKQIQIADAAFKVHKIKKNLKVTVSHVSENQPSHKPPPHLLPFINNNISSEAEEEEKREPSWTLRIEGRLETAGRQSKALQRPLSQYFKSVLIESKKSKESIERQTFNSADSSQTSENKSQKDSEIILEYNKNTCSEDYEEFQISQKGSESVSIKIILAFDQNPPKFRLSPELSALLGIKEATKPKVVLSLWQYIKQNKLQENEEKKVVLNDAILEKLFECKKMSFTEIPARLDTHLMPTDIIELDYLVSVDRLEGAATWDIEVEIDDPTKSKLIISPTVMSLQREISMTEQRIKQFEMILKENKQRAELLERFSKDPINTIHQLIRAHSEDQKILMGDPMHTINEDILDDEKFRGEEIEKIIAQLDNQ